MPLASTVTTTAYDTGVTAVGALAAVALTATDTTNVIITASSVTSGAVMELQGRSNGPGPTGGTSGWYPLRRFSVTADGRFAVPVVASRAGDGGVATLGGPSRPRPDHFRINVLTYTDGSFIFETARTTDPGDKANTTPAF